MALVRNPNPPPQSIGDDPSEPGATAPAADEIIAPPHSSEEEAWLARLDEVFGETGWPDA